MADLVRQRHRMAEAAAGHLRIVRPVATEVAADRQEVLAAGAAGLAVVAAEAMPHPAAEAMPHLAEAAEATAVGVTKT